MTERSNERVLVTGGAGFIGSALVRRLVAEGREVLTVDALTYAANMANLTEVADAPNHRFREIDIRDGAVMTEAVREFQPDTIAHLAAESHVDRSIDSPSAFIETNVVGTQRLLDVSLEYWNSLDVEARKRFVFHHVSTDEVYGSLGPTGAFTETTAYAPNSPYAASKASSDMLARAWFRTYGLPTVISNCSNNYGPFQFPEKLIPVVIFAGLDGRPIPIYGQGTNVRDWLFVEDHVDALRAIMSRGRAGEVYNVGGDAERTNLELAVMLCDILDDLAPDADIGSRRSLIEFVKDRPGHDFRYAIDAAKLNRELGWAPRTDIAEGLRRTVEWYVGADDWRRSIESDAHRSEPLGLGRRSAVSGARP